MREHFSSSPEKPVLVIGAVGLDIVGRLKDELKPNTSNPAQIRTTFGGVAHNVADNLARLGHPVRLVGVIGQDQAGDQLIQGMNNAGVDTSAVLRSSQQPTGSYLAVVNPFGKLLYALDDMRAISALTSEYIRQCSFLFEDASVIFLDANLPKPTLRTVMSLARRARIPVCADPTSQSLASKLRPYLYQMNLVVPNSAEAAILCDRTINPANPNDAIDAAKCLVSQGIEIAIITLAEFGLCYATSETSGHIPAIRTEIIDPTGAGDALTAAVIFALLNDIPLDDAVRLGVSAASLTLRHPGAVVPDLSLEKLYDQLVI